MATVSPDGPLAVAAAHPEPGDIDGDGVFDDVDNCPLARNGDQRDSDRGAPGGDTAGDACDEDDDADAVADAGDRCPLDADPGQADADGNGVGDACQGDRDGDGVIDAVDRCRERPDPRQPDADRDLVTDACDPDDDDDGVFDERDSCPLAANPDQLDADTDGRGAACDADDGARQGPSDATAPRARIRLGAPARLAAIGPSLPVAVRCSEACAVTARLALAPADARRLRLRRRVVAAGNALLGASGSTYAFLRFERGARRALRRHAPTRATLRVVVADRAGNDRILRRQVRLRR